MKANRTMLINALKEASKVYNQSAHDVEHERLQEQYTANAEATGELVAEAQSANVIELAPRRALVVDALKVAREAFREKGREQWALAADRLGKEAAEAEVIELVNAPRLVDQAR